MLKALKSFIRDEEGAQIVEYSLIIAVVSIGLILAMQNGSLFTGFTAWMDRVIVCLGVGPCV
jgi:pilus assembly protein Flp/PilA